MTAEITIMNRMAIALAADSAVTISSGSKHERIYNSANKLFMLSKYHPVGVMVFANANFMDIPWETIIKIYRKQLVKKEFDSLEGYAKDLLIFLENNRQLIPESLQIMHFEKQVIKVFTHIKSEIQKEFENARTEALFASIRKKSKAIAATFPEEKTFYEGVILKTSETWNQIPVIPNLATFDAKELINKHKEGILKIINVVFEEKFLSEVLKEKLLEIGINTFLKNIFNRSSLPNDFLDHAAGLVIGGFGKEEIYPGYIQFDLESIFENKLKYFESDRASVDKDGPIVRFFAQTDMAQTFTRGINPFLQIKIMKSMLSHLIKFKQGVLSLIPGRPAKIKKAKTDALDGLAKKFRTDHEAEVNDIINNNFIQPIVNTVSTLPKDELATMAETLVNITSFKRRVSGDAETVGGPVDVAVISKGDGFVWIKRKHYFDPKLNPHFVTNYYKGDGDE